jgi:hypothetical protein
MKMVAPTIPLYPKRGFRLKTGMTSVTMPKNGSATMYTSGCPKNQNRCCHRIGPPVAGSYTWAPRCRSASSASRAAARSGNTMIIITLVMRTFQVKIGIRNIVIPGARRVTIVVIMLTAPRMVPRPERTSPMIHMSAPTSGWWVASDSGG